jgi:hypothetical protein
MKAARSKIENFIGTVLVIGAILFGANVVDDVHDLKFELACAELHGYEQRFIHKHLPDQIFDDKGFIEKCKAN